jgi:hypothetical protein
VHIVRGDQGDDTALMQRIRSDFAPGGFEVIVADASHVGITTARSLKALTPNTFALAGCIASRTGTPDTCVVGVAAGGSPLA